MISRRLIVLLLLIIPLGLALARWAGGSPSCPPVCLGEKLGAVNWDRRNLIDAVMIDAIARHASMADVDFNGAELTGFDLVGGNLKGTNLAGANLIGADLGGAYLSGAVFNATNLTGANLAQADLTGTSLTNSRLAAVNFNKTRLVNADLSQLDLSGAYLNDSQISGGNLNRIKLSGGVLDRVDLSGADLRYADLRGAWINLSTLAGANFHGADLSGASLIGSDLTGCNLSGASLAGANLIGAVFRGANLSGANLSAAQLIPTPELLDRDLLDDSIFRNLSETQWENLNLGGVILDGATYDIHTRWPQGYSPPVSAIYAPSIASINPEPSDEILIGVAGSRSVFFLASVLARGYMRTHPEFFFKFTVTDSADGISRTGKGQTTIGMSSRAPTAEELAQYPQLRVFPIAREAVSVVVNPQNPVSHLTLVELRSILSGEITNWKEAGGTDLEIAVLSQNDTLMDFVSGELLGGEGIPDGLVEIQPSHAAVRAEVSRNPGAIGLLPLHLADRSVKEISFAGMQPAAQMVVPNDYPLIRTFYLLVKGEPGKISHDWISFIQSEAGRSLMEEEGVEVIQNDGS